MRISQPYGLRYNEEENSQEPKKKFFIACEGEKTEYQYFKGVMQCRYEIGINPLIEVIPIKHDRNTGSNPRNIYNEAKEAIDESESLFLEGDELCIIADRDKKSFTPEQFDFLKEKHLAREIRFVLSNPCFEFWLLLHLDDCKSIDRAELLENRKSGSRNYVSTLLKERLGGYNKKRIHFISCFKDHIEDAIKNAKNFETDIVNLDTRPGTNICFLLEDMMTIDS